MPLTEKELREIQHIAHSEMNSGKSRKEAYRIANAKVYSQKRKLERM